MLRRNPAAQPRALDAPTAAQVEKIARLIFRSREDILALIITKRGVGSLRGTSFQVDLRDAEDGAVRRGLDQIIPNGVSEFGLESIARRIFAERGANDVWKVYIVPRHGFARFDYELS